MTLTGSGFYADGDYEAIVLYMGAESTSATIDDETTVTATFDNGIPLASAVSAPSLRFIPASTDRRRLVALADADIQLVASSTVEIDNTLAVSDSTSGLSCSFQGGCSYTVTADGLTASILADSENNYIDVCGNNLSLIHI